MEFAEFIGLAIQVIVSGNNDLYEVVHLSLYVSFSAVFFAALIGLPLGGLLASTRFPGRSLVIVLINALMGLPPVVVVCINGLGSIHSQILAVEKKADMGTTPPPRALPRQRISGATCQ